MIFYSSRKFNAYKFHTKNKNQSEFKTVRTCDGFLDPTKVECDGQTQRNPKDKNVNILFQFSIEFYNIQHS